MSGLTELLRDRASRRGRTARVPCGALGTVTVEALSPADCAALARRGDRALLYAACRELQESGEALRRKGLLYQPDEIMDYVTGAEAEEAVRAVRALSGLAPEPEKTPEPEAPEPEETPEPEAPEPEETPENRLPFVRNGGKEFPQVRPDAVREPEPEDGQADERRLEIVRASGTDFPEVRLASVRSGPPDRSPFSPEAEGGKTLPSEKHGQASREFPEGVFLPEAQNLPEKLQMRLQHVAVSSPDPSGDRRKRQRTGSAGEALRRTAGTEIREGAHEDKSESQPLPEGETHETRSEFRPLSCGTPGDAARKPGAEFVESREPPDVETLAWALLEGLRRAAGAR